MIRYVLVSDHLRHWNSERELRYDTHPSSNDDNGGLGHQVRGNVRLYHRSGLQCAVLVWDISRKFILQRITNIIKASSVTRVTLRRAHVLR